jgi:hypothetical protein
MSDTALMWSAIPTTQKKNMRPAVGPRTLRFMEPEPSSRLVIRHDNVSPRGVEKPAKPKQSESVSRTDTGFCVLDRVVGSPPLLYS